MRREGDNRFKEDEFDVVADAEEESRCSRNQFRQRFSYLFFLSFSFRLAVVSSFPLLFLFPPSCPLFLFFPFFSISSTSPPLNGFNHVILCCGCMGSGMLYRFLLCAARLIGFSYVELRLKASISFLNVMSYFPIFSEVHTFTMAFSQNTQQLLVTRIPAGRQAEARRGWPSPHFAL